MKDCMATEIMMDKARTMTLIQKLCGERIQIKNPCSASNCLNYSHFRVQFYLPSPFLHLLCVDSKNNINYRMFPHAVWLNLFCLNY